MQATVYIDVLSHWCLVAAPAMRALTDLIPDVEIVYAPLNDGEPLGFTNDMETWYYSRGSKAYGRTLIARWCEGPQTRTWFANAAALVAGEITGQPLRAAHAMMSGAMEQGLMLGRPDEVYRYVGEALNIPGSEVAKRIAEPRVAELLNEGNRRLAAAGSDKRPTFEISNDCGDRVLLKGVWQTEAVGACALALLHDERAYAAAGTPPFAQL